IVAGTRDAVMMIEAGASQVPEATMLEAIELARSGIRAAIEAQDDLVRQAGKPKMEWTPEKVEAEKGARISQFLTDRGRAKVRQRDKAQREAGLAEVKKEAVAALVTADGDITEGDVSLTFEAVVKKEFRRAVLEEGIRPDGRGLKDIRQLSIE